MNRFDVWSFLRDVLYRGTRIEQHCESQGYGYEIFSAKLDAAARDYADKLQPHLATEMKDDDQDADFDWLARNANLCRDEGYWDQPPTGDVWWEAGPISFTCDSYQSDPGEPSVTVATDWQVEGQMLPKLLIPKTRGDFRALCRLVGHKIEERQ
jgi:hypothetical protein